ncbi:MAG: ISL3 family transposase [Pseudonocardiales bacterium]|nr:ISL3 family transposase [Pseudonocardiales bacterium]
MSHATGSPRDAASVLFDLPGYRVEAAVDLPGGGREVSVAAATTQAPCPDCGVFSDRVHQRTRQRVRDVPVAGRVEVVLIRRRFACAEAACPRRTFVEVSDEVPLRARTTTRLRVVVLDAVVRAGRVVSEVAAGHGLSWWTVQRTVLAASVLLTDPDAVPVRRLGIDEHRYRSVRYYRDTTGAWRRFEPWMTTIVDADTGRVLGVVDGRDSAGVGGWLGQRSAAWRDAVEVVAIDPSAAFRRAIRQQLPRAALSVDAFHLVKLGNDMVTRVRQRVTREAKGRRGRLVDSAWVNRRLLLRAGDTLSAKARARLRATLAADDPTNEIGAAWGVKERLRQLLQASSLEQAEQRRDILAGAVALAGMPETDRLLATVQAWWSAIEVLIVTGVTNARTEAANTSIKQIKRSGRGYRNAAHYRARILLASAARRAA